MSVQTSEIRLIIPILTIILFFSTLFHFTAPMGMHVQKPAATPCHNGYI